MGRPGGRTRRFYYVIEKILREYYLGYSIASIYKKDIHAFFYKASKEERDQVIDYLRYVIPSYYQLQYNQGYIDISTDLLKIFCLDHKIKNNFLLPGEQSLPTEVNERLVNIYKNVLELFTKRNTPYRVRYALGLYLPDAMTILEMTTKDGRNQTDMYVRPRFFLTALLRSLSRLRNEWTDRVWNIILDDHQVEKATMVYINLILMIGKRLSWWVFSGDDLLTFSCRFSKEAVNWTYLDCRKMTSAIYRTRAKYLVECLVERNGDFHPSDQAMILMKMVHVFNNTWLDLTFQYLDKVLPTDIAECIKEFLCI